MAHLSMIGSHFCLRQRRPGFNAKTIELFTFVGERGAPGH